MPMMPVKPTKLPGHAAHDVHSWFEAVGAFEAPLSQTSCASHLPCTWYAAGVGFLRSTCVSCCTSSESMSSSSRIADTLCIALAAIAATIASSIYIMGSRHKKHCKRCIVVMFSYAYDASLDNTCLSPWSYLVSLVGSASGKGPLCNRTGSAWSVLYRAELRIHAKGWQ